MNKDYNDLVNFWNNSFALTDEDKQSFEGIDSDNDWKDIAPSEKQLNALNIFKDKENILDYGAGNGWASIVMSKLGVKNITACDVAPNFKELLSCFAGAFKVNDNINSVVIDENWLKNEDSEKYDGFFTSNVIDVIPLEMSKEIIKESARVLKKGAKAIFSFNYYIEPKLMEERGAVVKDKQIYINNVLRLTSLTDEEWSNEFKKYYKILDLTYFSWQGEAKEARRLFTLERI